MNLYLLLLASLTAPINAAPTLPSPGVDSNITLPLPSLGVAYRCASPAQRDPGRQMPSALDCLNVLTFILATTSNHNRPTQWSVIPGPDHTRLPYRRSSGTCQLLVRLTPMIIPAPTTEIATFDEVIGAAMRIIEVCLLNSNPDVEYWGGAALAGLNKYLDIVVWGSPSPGDNSAALNESGAWVTQISQT